MCHNSPWKPINVEHISKKSLKIYQKCYFFSLKGWSFEAFKAFPHSFLWSMKRKNRMRISLQRRLTPTRFSEARVLLQGFLQQLRQIAGRMSSGPRGAGVGLKLLIGAGALAYGVKEAMYTGMTLQHTCTDAAWGAKVLLRRCVLHFRPCSSQTGRAQFFTYNRLIADRQDCSWTSCVDSYSVLVLLKLLRNIQFWVWCAKIKTRTMKDFCCSKFS